MKAVTAPQVEVLDDEGLVSVPGMEINDQDYRDMKRLGKKQEFRVRDEVC